MSTFSERLKRLRIESGENQSDVASVIGVSVQSYSAYEGSREPKYELLVKLAEHFNVSTDYLLGVSDTKKPENEDIIKRLGLSEKAIDILSDLKEDVFTQNYDECYQTLSDLIENDNFLEALEIIHHLRFGSFDRKQTAPGAFYSAVSHTVEDETFYHGARWEAERLINEAIDKLHEGLIQRLTRR